MLFLNTDLSFEILYRGDGFDEGGLPVIFRKLRKRYLIYVMQTALVRLKTKRCSVRWQKHF